MASQPNPRLPSSSASAEDNVVELGDVKLKVPLPSWAKTTIAILSVVASVSTAIGPIVVGKHKEEDKRLEVIRQKKDEQHQAEDVKVDAVARVGDVQLEEFKKHFQQTPDNVAPIPTKPGTGVLKVSCFDNDGCILVTRSTPDGKHQSSLWVRKITSDEVGASPGATGAVQEVGSSKPPPAPSPATASPTLPVAAALVPDQLQLAAFSTDEPLPQSLRPVQACRGRCTNPHPGQPNTAHGQTNGCWIQIVRTWPDRCSQYQWYDSCHSVLDPKIYWSCCND
jgi:hypothetical protein